MALRKRLVRRCASIHLRHVCRAIELWRQMDLFAVFMASVKVSRWCGNAVFLNRKECVSFRMGVFIPLPSCHKKEPFRFLRWIALGNLGVCPHGIPRVPRPPPCDQFLHAAFCFGHGAHAFWTWGVLISSWGVLISSWGVLFWNTGKALEEYRESA